MTAAIAQTDEQWAVAQVLERYRRYRVLPWRKSPYDAVCEVVDGAARYLADVVVDDGPHLELAKLRYLAARALHAEVCRRADIGGDRDFEHLTAVEQFWNTGRTGGAL